MKKVVIALAGLFFLSASVVEARKLDDVKNLEKALGKQVIIYVQVYDTMHATVRGKIVDVTTDEVTIKLNKYLVSPVNIISIKEIIGVDIPRHKLTRWLTFGLASKYVAIYMRSDVLKRYKESKK